MQEFYALATTRPRSAAPWIAFAIGMFFAVLAAMGLLMLDRETETAQVRLSPYAAPHMALPLTPAPS